MKTANKNGDTKTDKRSAMAASPGERETISLGIPPSVVAESVECLNRTLANVYVLLVKTKKCHWDVSGPQFMTLHKMLDEQYVALDAFADMAAERVRMLGAFPVGTIAGFLQLTDLREQPTDIPTATEVVITLLKDHETIVRTLRTGIKTVEDGDAGTADMLTEMLRKHEEFAWMLRAFVQGEGVHAVSSTQAALRPRSGNGNGNGNKSS